MEQESQYSTDTDSSFRASVEIDNFQDEGVKVDVIDCKKKYFEEHETFVYYIEIRHIDELWVIERSYTDFERLQNWIHHLFPKERLKIPELPPKVNPFKSNREIIEQRKEKFRSYLARLLHNVSISSTYEFCDFLDLNKHIIRPGITKHSQGQLYLCVSKARNVPKASNVFVEIEFASSLLPMNANEQSGHQKTESRPSTFPVWNDEYLYTVTNRSRPLRISLWHDSLLKLESFGFLEIDLNALPEGEMIEDWFDLLDGYSDAEISLQMKFLPKPVSDVVATICKMPHASTKLPDFRIELDSYPTYYPGDKVSGQVVIYRGRAFPTEITRLRLSFDGYQQTHWVEQTISTQVDQTNTPIALTETHRGKFTILEHNLVLFDYKMELWKKLSQRDGHLPPGQYRFPFLFQFPFAGIPPSVKGPHGDTTYQLTALLQHKKKPLVKVVTPLTLHVHCVEQKVNEESPPGVKFSQFITSAEDKNSSVSISLYMESQWLFIGRTQGVRVVVENHTKNNVVNGMVVRIKTLKYLFFEQDIRTSYHPGQKASFTVLEMEISDGFPIIPEKQKEFLVDLTIPEDTPPTMRTPESTLIALEYELVVECKMREEQKWNSERVQLKHHVLVCHPPKSRISVSSTDTITEQDESQPEVDEDEKPRYLYSSDLNTMLEVSTSTRKPSRTADPNVRVRTSLSKTSTPYHQNNPAETSNQQFMGSQRSFNEEMGAVFVPSHIGVHFLKPWNINTELRENYIDSKKGY